MPGSGDSIQALKAGVMEIPDLVVLTSPTCPTAQAARSELAQVLRLAEPRARRRLVETSATDGRRRRGAVGRDRRRAGRRSSSPVRSPSGAARASSARCSGSPRPRRATPRAGARAAGDDLRALLDRVAARELDPLRAVAEVLERVYGIRE